MKTVMDAVIEFRGSIGAVYDRDLCILYHTDVGTYSLATIEEYERLNYFCKSFTMVCPINTFNATVTLLSHAPWIKGASLEEYQAANKEVLQPRSGNMKIDISSNWISGGSGGGKSSFGVELDDKGLLKTFVSKEVVKVEDKTVEVDGMVYEIGKWYEFSNDKDNWEASKLDAVEGSNFVFRTSLGWMRFCREAKLSVGTITPAPVKLIDGEAYMFECQGEARLGFKFGEYMRIDKYTKFSIDRCSNITRLVPEVE